MKAKIDPVLKEFASVFSNNGKQVFLVGGAVRDMLMGKKIHDWDLATDALPDEVMSIFRAKKGKVIPTGIKHGTVTVLYKNSSAEVTTFRTESEYSDSRRPDKVNYALKIEDDLSRRDFTMNAIALNLLKNEIVDPFCGAKDIKKKIIRCVGDANERFKEDGLRPLRAVRFASQLGFEIEKITQDAIPFALCASAKVSQERVRDEIEKILSSPVPSQAFLLMEKTGLLKLFLSELADCRGIEQKGFHQFDVLDHSLSACDYAAKKSYSQILRMAALLHDTGKPSVRRLDESGVWTFYRHEEESVKISVNILNRLRFPGAFINSVCHLIKEHMFQYTEEWSDAAVRRFIARVGEENLEDFYDLRMCDAYGFSGKEPDCRPVNILSDRVKEVTAKSRAFAIKDLAINGNDLIIIGIESGKMIGTVLRELLETVLDDPAQNTREKLLKIAESYHQKISSR